MCGSCLSRVVPTLARGLGFLPGKWAHALLCVKRSEEPLLEPLSSADASPLAVLGTELLLGVLGSRVTGRIDSVGPRAEV